MSTHKEYSIEAKYITFGFFQGGLSRAFCAYSGQWADALLYNEAKSHLYLLLPYKIITAANGDVRDVSRRPCCQTPLSVEHKLNDKTVKR